VKTLALAVVVAASTASAQLPLGYTVDLSDTAHHVFAVTLDVPPLADSNAVLEFAATAPGTYQTMDIGRFVRGFTALDADGAPVAAEQIGTNEWRLSSPERVRRIVYHVIATRDTSYNEERIYPMCGTVLESSYALINGQAVFGFPHGMQAAPLTITLHYPSTWTLGTPLSERGGLYVADSYDQLVDSPILLGANLTRATLEVTGVPVTIVVHAAQGDVGRSPAPGNTPTARSTYYRTWPTRRPTARGSGASPPTSSSTS
jgi:predicted metalloprotease with PDZ domain